MVNWGPDPARLPSDPREQVRREIFEHDAGPAGPRPIVGFIYELLLDGQPEDQHSYVGKAMGATEAAVTRRLHGPQASAHTSPRSVAIDPWKASILPGRRGYRILERIRDTGDEGENDRAVRRAEAFWIDRLRPLHNDVRPVRPPVSGTPARRRPAAPAPEVKPRRQPLSRAQFHARMRTAGVLALLAIYATLVALLLRAGGAQGPFAWLTPPVVALVLTWRTVAQLDRPKRRRKRW